MWPSQVSWGPELGSGQEEGLGLREWVVDTDPYHSKGQSHSPSEPLWTINTFILLEALGIQVRTIQTRCLFSWSSPSGGQRQTVSRIKPIQRVWDGSKWC